MLKNRKKIIVGIDVSPLFNDNKIRGIGFYTIRLIEALKKDKSLKIKELKKSKDIQKWDFDVLHIPYFSPFFFTTPLLIKKPVVVTIHDLIPIKYPKHYPPGTKGRICWQLQKFLLKRNVRFIITDSLASKYDISFLTKFPQDRIYPIYLAAGKEFRIINKKSLIFKRVRLKYKLPENFVLYVGDVNWNKNVPLLVKACFLLGIPLVIVGKQAAAKDYDPFHIENKSLVELQNLVQKVGNLNSRAKIFLLGFVPTEELVAIYNLATVYCQPSFDEGFGLPVLEAMACGCPVVATDRGSLPEIVGESGLLVRPTMMGLKMGLKKVYFNKFLRQNLINRGLKRVKEFSWEETAQKTAFVYRLCNGMIDTTFKK